DSIALSKIGIENVVAPLGTALTKNQIEILFRTTNEIILFLDGDQAGLNAMNKTINIALPLINSGKIIKFAFLPAGLDPDDFINQQGRSACEELLKQAKPMSEALFDFEVKNLEIKDLNQKISPEKKVKLEESLMKRVDLISDINSKKYFSQYYRDLLFQLGRNFKKNSPNISKIDPAQSINIDYLSIYAKSIITLLTQDPKLIDYQDNYCNIRDIEFENEDLAEIKDNIISFYDQNKDCKTNEMLENIIKNTNLYNEISNKLLLTKNNNNQIKIRILALKYYHHQVCDQYKNIINKMSDFTNSSSLKDGQQKAIFEYRTKIEKEILKLENSLT
ncbi:toprim domain-containing protein, partial [Rickettsiales bacterium]|nr:toprim domain-containing protein [Rickettsiales bacterium]